MILWMKIIVITLVLFIILDIYRFLLNIFRPNKNNKKVIFDKVLLVDDVVGNPFVEGASVEGVVLKHGKKKILKYILKIQRKRRKQQMSPL